MRDQNKRVFRAKTAGRELLKLMLDAVRRMQKAMSRRGKGGRKKKRGRKSRRPRQQQPAAG